MAFGLYTLRFFCLPLLSGGVSLAGEAVMSYNALSRDFNPLPAAPYSPYLLGQTGGDKLCFHRLCRCRLFMERAGFGE